MHALVFTKFPQPGMVKTRLGQAVGLEWAASLQTAFVQDELCMLAGIDARVTLYCDPFRPLADYERLYGTRPRYRKQQGADLGERMLHALHTELKDCGEAVVLIGSDLPDLPEGHLTSAFAALRSAPLCLGPAPDGGFYLLGLREPLPPDIFDGVLWGGALVLRRTLDNCLSRGLTPHLLQPWPDVDTGADLAAYAARNRGRATHSMNLIRSLGLEEGTWKD